MSAFVSMEFIEKVLELCIKLNGQENTDEIEKLRDEILEDMG